MPTIIATAGGATSNSYETLAEASTYFDERLPLPTPWIASGDTSIRALIMATRVLDAMAQPYKTFMPGEGAYFIQRKKWTGAPATTTQRLAWPRTGMYDSNGNLIASDVIPQALKDAESELAGQLIIKAGSVSLSFKEMIEQHVLPSAVLNLMPPSWLTDEEITYPTTALFEVI
jgi:hypothetical protein